MRQKKRWGEKSPFKNGSVCLGQVEALSEMAAVEVVGVLDLDQFGEF